MVVTRFNYYTFSATINIATLFKCQSENLEYGNMFDLLIVGITLFK